MIPVVVIHNELPLTLAALGEATRLARGLDARLMLLAVRVVPFPEPLDPSRGLPDMPALVALAEAADLPVTVQVVYARNWETAYEQVLAKGSLVVIAQRRRPDRLARWLAGAGHHVTTVAA